MARWIKITEDNGITSVVDVDQIAAIVHEPSQDNKKDKYIVFLPSGQLTFSLRESPEGHRIMEQYMKILESLVT